MFSVCIFNILEFTPAGFAFNSKLCCQSLAFFVCLRSKKKKKKMIN